MSQARTKKALEKTIEKTVKDLCQPSGHSGYPYVIGTKLGLLWVSPHDNWVACRFEEPEKAREVYSCNPHSGKHNFHGDECAESFADLIEDLERQGRLLEPKEFAAQLASFNADWEAKLQNWGKHIGLST